MEAHDDLQRYLDMHRANFAVVSSSVLAPYRSGDDRVLMTEGRAKSYDSALRRVTEKNQSPPDLHDLTGLRIVTTYEDEEKQIADELCRRFGAAELEEKIKPNGYRSTHVRITLGENEKQLLGVKSDSLPFRIEIQIRTVAAHIWSELEHKYQYDEDSPLPDHLLLSFQQLADRLRQVDRQLIVLRDASMRAVAKAVETVARRESQPVNVLSIEGAIDGIPDSRRHDAVIAQVRGARFRRPSREEMAQAAAMFAFLGRHDLTAILDELSGDADYETWLRLYNGREAMRRGPRLVAEGETLLLYPQYLALRERSGVAYLTQMLRAAGAGAPNWIPRLYHEVQLPFERALRR